MGPSGGDARGDVLGHGRRGALDAAGPPWEHYGDAIAAFPTTIIADESPGTSMLYSSGTTGQPKGIRRPLSGLAIDDPSRTGIAALERFLLGIVNAENAVGVIAVPNPAITRDLDPPGTGTRARYVDLG